MQKDSLHDITQETICPICIECFKDPRILPECGHSFCKTCLDCLLSSKTFMACPLCAAEYFFPNGTQSLPRNFTLANIIERLKADGKSESAVLSTSEELRNSFLHASAPPLDDDLSPDFNPPQEPMWIDDAYTMTMSTLSPVPPTDVSRFRPSPQLEPPRMIPRFSEYDFPELGPPGSPHFHQQHPFHPPYSPNQHPFASTADFKEFQPVPQYQHTNPFLPKQDRNPLFIDLTKEDDAPKIFDLTQAPLHPQYSHHQYQPYPHHQPNFDGSMNTRGTFDSPTHLQQSTLRPMPGGSPMQQPPQNLDQCPFIPFKIKPSGVSTLFDNWRFSLWWAPSGFNANLFHLSTEQQVYVPHYVFHADCQVHISAKASHKDSSNWVPVTTTKRGLIDDVVCVGLGPDVEYLELLDELADTYRIGEEEPPEDVGFGSWLYQSVKGIALGASEPDLSDKILSADETPKLPAVEWQRVWERTCKKHVETQEMKKAESHLQKSLSSGSTFVNISVEAKPADLFTWKLVYLPLYLCTYHFGGAKYYFVVNGQTGSFAGARPYGNVARLVHLGVSGLQAAESYIWG